MLTTVTQTGNSGVTNSEKTLELSTFESKTNTTEESTLPPYMTVYMWKRTA